MPFAVAMIFPAPPLAENAVRVRARPSSVEAELLGLRAQGSGLGVNSQTNKLRGINTNIMRSTKELCHQPATQPHPDTATDKLRSSPSCSPGSAACPGVELDAAAGHARHAVGTDSTPPWPGCTSARPFRSSRRSVTATPFQPGRRSPFRDHREAGVKRSCAASAAARASRSCWKAPTAPP